MGANCCVAARSKPSPQTISCDVSHYRNVRHSPSWSFRWDNRTHIEDIMDNPSRFSNQNSVNVSSEIKSTANTEIEGFSDGGSSSDAFHISKFRKPLNKVAFAGSSKSIVADQSFGSNSPPEESGYINSPAVASASDTNPSISIPSTPSFSSLKAAGGPTYRCSSLPSDQDSSKKAGRSPCCQLSRQVSADSRIPSLKSLNESGSCSPESRQSFVLSVCSNDMSFGGSQGGSSDGWSMRTFSELVAASSQRDRWSLDSENLSSINSKFTRSSPQSTHIQICRVCSRLLKEKSPWSVQKIVSTNDIYVAAVLVCGHVYHAECLESMTSELDRYDPPCPVCTNGEKLAPRLLGKAELKGKISRGAVVDIDVDGNPVSDHCKAGGKNSKMRASSSMKASFGGPFLRRHFSIGSRQPPARSASESEATRKKKKGFWARYRKE